MKNIFKKYSDDSFALSDVDLFIRAHERVGIVGETGSGKSTLLRTLGGLEQPTSGEVLFEEKKIKGPHDQLIPGHKQVIYLSQYFKLPKFITVAQHLDNPYELSSAQAQQINHACQIEHLLTKDTSELSGGEKQRVSFAKCLTLLPKVLLLDEPFSNLDFIHKRVIKEVIDSIEKELGTTVIMVAHDPRDILAWADTILVFKHGRIMQLGKPEEIYHKPINEYVAGLFGNYNVITPSLWNLKKPKDSKEINGKVIVRPERFSTSQSDSKGISGVVEKVFFQGSHDELVVKVNNEIIVTYSQVGTVKTGEKVNLTIS